MKTLQTKLNLLIAFVLIAATGCATPRGNIDQTGSQALWSNSTPGGASYGSSSVEPVHIPSTNSHVKTVSYETQTAIPAETVDFQSADHLVPNEPPFSNIAAANGLTLEALEQIAEENNPSIRQAYAAVCKTMGIRTQVGLKPNPMIGYFGEEIGNDSASGLHGIFVSKTIVRGDKLALNRQVISHDVDAARLQLEAQRLRVRNDVRVQFYETLAAQRRLNLASEFREIAVQGVEISKDLVKAKEAARPDILQSEIQLSEVDLAIQRAQFDLQAAWNELVAMTGMPSQPLTPLIGELKIPLVMRDAETVFAEIVAVSPLLSAACARVHRAQANLNRQRVQPIPNVNAQLGVGHDNGTGDEFANVQLSVPIPWHNMNEGNIQAAQADYCEATQNVKRIQMQIRRDVARVMREYQVAASTVEQYESSIVPKAKESLALLAKAQEAGEFDFLRVLTARRAYFEVQNQYIRALSKLASANVRIEGLLLTGGLADVGSYNVNDELRGQALNSQ